MSERAPGSPGLADRLASLCACRKAAEPEMIAEVVRAVLETVGGHLSEQDARLLAEVEELGRTIAEAKAEIAALRVDDVTASQIPSATDELDAVVAHTAAATNAILEACETLDEAAASMGEPHANALQAATMRIYEACSFQDVTGQRITKVVSTLKAIDAKVAHITSTFGDNRHVRGVRAPEKAPAPAEAALLNGPQLPAAAMDQAEIDRMLADF